MNKNHTYIILAGSNGAGKSTFREVIGDKLKEIKIIDPDYIAKQLDDSIKDKNMVAAKKAIELMKDNFKNKVSFIQETTLSGNLNNNINIAKLQGYRVELVYIAIPNTEIAKDNIKERVALGGHHIPEVDVERRFTKSYNNLVNLSNRVDNLTILDNSRKCYDLILNIEKGKILYKAEDIPKWLQETVSKVIESSKQYNNEKVFSVNQKQYQKLIDDKLIKPNPFANESNPNNIKILAASKEVINAIQNILEFDRDR